jgi:hypothetical protein
MVDEWLVSAFGVVPDLFERSSDASLDFGVICNAFERGPGFFNDAESQCGVEIVDQLYFDKNETSRLDELMTYLLDSRRCDLEVGWDVATKHAGF